MSLLNGNKFLSLICAATLASAAYAGACDNRVFNIKIGQNASVGEILNELSDTCHFSVIKKDAGADAVLNENVSGINIKDMGLNDIFDVLIAQNDLSYEFKKDVLKIASTQTRTFKIDYITSVREGRATVKASVDAAPVDIDDLSGNSDGHTSSENQDNIIQTTERFDFWEKLNEEIKALLNNGSEKTVAPDPIINPNAGLVTVTGTAAQIKRIEDYIDKLEKSLKKQVLLDVSILSIQLNNEFKRGVDWSKFQLGFNTYLGDGSTPSGFYFGKSYVTLPSTSQQDGGFVIGGSLNFSLDGVLNFLETKGRTKVVSSPKIMAMNNQQAIISVGDNVNYQIVNGATNLESSTSTTQTNQYSIFIGVLLNILPEVSEDGKIMLRINPSLSNFKWNDDNTRLIDDKGDPVIRQIAPDTVQKKLSTVVRVNDGDTVIIGGLIAEQIGKDINKVPVLGDIPVLGYFFKSVKDTLSTNELIFVITPHLVDPNGSGPIKESLKDLGFFKVMYE